MVISGKSVRCFTSPPRKLMFLTPWGNAFEIKSCQREGSCRDASWLPLPLLPGGPALLCSPVFALAAGRSRGAARYEKHTDEI